jgi:arginyl-tRNA synthetase
VLISLKHKFDEYIKSNFGDVSYHLLINTDPHKKEFGDLNSNVAMQLAKNLKKNPKAIAEEIAANFKNEFLDKIEIAGPGFLNLFLKVEAYKHLAKKILIDKENAFKYEIKPENISLEFVSANPTGPLHIGHGRGAIIGDVLANIWTFLGHKVTREYYINDAGAQIGKLGRSLKVRIDQEKGLSAELPEDAYHGEYLIDLAIEYLQEKRSDDQTELEEFAKEKLLKIICETLSKYGITFDVWFSEKSLHESGAISTAIEHLTNQNHTYEHEGSLWFRSTSYGDDKDRVVRKSSGELTYVAADIAYMKNKIDRGAQRLVMILGHDHHSYVTRLKSLQQAMGLGQYPFDIILYQLVKIQKGGERVRMSKRAGNSITLDDIIDTIGKDAARFFYLNRKADADLDLDIDLAMQKNDDNPLFYVQYANVRIKSVLDRAAQEKITGITSQDILNAESLENEKDLIKKIYQLQELLEQIAHNNQTHLLAYYTIELAHSLHSYYSKNRVVNPADISNTRMKLAVLEACKIAFETTFKLLGISCPERM